MSILKSLPTTKNIEALKAAWDAIPSEGTVPDGVASWLQPLINAVTEIVNPPVTPINDGFCRVAIVSDGTPGGTRVTCDGKALCTTRVSFDVGIDGAAIVKMELYGGDVDLVITADARADAIAATTIAKNVAMTGPATP